MATLPRMATLTVRTPDDGSEWTDERLGYLSAAVVQFDDVLYPVTGARVDDGAGALLTVDTGDGGPAPDVGDPFAGYGVVEHVG